MKNILVACEESQAVTKEFRELGFEAYSCDIEPCSGGHPEWHIQDDAIEVLNSKEWDLVIAHPPCTRLANSGVRWLKERNLWKDLEEAKVFFNHFVEYGNRGNRIAIENPIPHKYAELPKYSQIIQPWMFGHGETKATCLWLYNLPLLKPTNIVEGREQRLHKLPPNPNRSKLRSKTFSGVAKALAFQYGNFIKSNIEIKDWNNFPLSEINRIFA